MNGKYWAIVGPNFLDYPGLWIAEGSLCCTSFSLGYITMNCPSIVLEVGDHVSRKLGTWDF
jgi:hypothetical protein